jgi:hypothetical protein
MRGSAIAELKEDVEAGTAKDVDGREEEGGTARKWRRGAPKPNIDLAVAKEEKGSCDRITGRAQARSEEEPRHERQDIEDEL